MISYNYVEYRNLQLLVVKLNMVIILFGKKQKQLLWSTTYVTIIKIKHVETYSSCIVYGYKTAGSTTTEER